METRPDLNNIPDEVRTYIESLEAELARLQSAKPAHKPDKEAAAEPSEPPTTINLFTISRDGYVKRTPRHLYSRQRRGGMGVFDLETAASDHPTLLTTADEADTLILFTDDGRAFRLPAAKITEAEVRAKGQSLHDLLQLRPHEQIVAALPDDGGTYLVLVSQRGWARRVRRNYVGPSMIPGISFHDVKEGGPLAAACWTDGSGDVFIATEEGKAIRFNEAQIPARGCLGLRVDVTDRVVGVTAVTPGSGVFLSSADGKGTIRLMSGFSANKAPGAGGKVAIKSDKLVGGTTVSDNDDIFLISRLGKLIRFRADEIPAKEGVVQGVNCMSLRHDEVVGLAASSNVSGNQ
jgi:DNA gyrase subunit A